MKFRIIVDDGMENRPKIKEQAESGVFVEKYLCLLKMMDNLKEIFPYCREDIKCIQEEYSEMCKPTIFVKSKRTYKIIPEFSKYMDIIKEISKMLIEYKYIEKVFVMDFDIKIQSDSSNHALATCIYAKIYDYICELHEYRMGYFNIVKYVNIDEPYVVITLNLEQCSESVYDDLGDIFYNIWTNFGLEYKKYEATQLKKSCIDKVPLMVRPVYDFREVMMYGQSLKIDNVNNDIKKEEE